MLTTTTPRKLSITDHDISVFTAKHAHTLGHRSKLPGTHVIKRADIAEFLRQNGFSINVKTLNVGIREFSANTKNAGVTLVPKFRQGKSYLTLKGSMLFLVWLTRLDNLGAHIEMWELTYMQQATLGRAYKARAKA